MISSTTISIPILWDSAEGVWVDMNDRVVPSIVIADMRPERGDVQAEIELDIKSDHGHIAESRDAYGWQPAETWDDREVTEARAIVGNRTVILGQASRESAADHWGSDVEQAEIPC